MLQKKLQHLDIILASQSPRRQELLKGLDIDFRIETRPVDEVYSKELKAGEITAFLSEVKAKAFQNDIKDNQLIITSDTIVWLEDAALEKPKDLNHAKEMLASMSGKMHEVFTSVTFTTSHSQDTITDSTSSSSSTDSLSVFQLIAKLNIKTSRVVVAIFVILGNCLKAIDRL